MCLILFSYQQHPDYPLILAANRDEFYARPTRPAGFWPESPQLLAGRDLQAGGTWMGLTREGRFAAITNFREGEPTTDRPSRGALCTDYLLGADNIDDYTAKLQTEASQYAGFNLLLGSFRDPQNPQIAYFSNRSDNSAAANSSILKPDIYGLSNALLNSHWPKVDAGKQALTENIDCRMSNLLSILQNKDQASDDKLPSTGIDKSLEKKLSSRFIAIEGYGTRSSTILRIRKDGLAEWLEQEYDSSGEAKSENYCEFFITKDQ